MRDNFLTAFWRSIFIDPVGPAHPAPPLAAEQPPPPLAAEQPPRNLSTDVFASVRYMRDGAAWILDQMMVLDGTTPARALVEQAEAQLPPGAMILSLSLYPDRVAPPDMDFMDCF